MIEKALNYYHFDNPTTELLRHSEKQTYKITVGEKSFVLRIHKPVEGFNQNDTNKQVLNEIELLLHLSKKCNLLLQEVILNKFGKPVTLFDDEIPVTVLEWIDGSVLDSIEITESIAYEVGVMTGKLHIDLADMKLESPRNYDDILTLSMCNETSNALRQGHFDEKQARIITDALVYIQSYFLRHKHRFTLVHGDLSHSNMVYHENKIVPIDFSSNGRCIPEMDLAMIFGCINDENLNQHVLNGYKSVCRLKLDYTGIDACSCLCILLFVVHQHERGISFPWFKDKVNDWCENKFTPLIENKEKSWLRLWKDVV